MCWVSFPHCATLFWDVKLFAGEMYTQTDKQQLHLRFPCPSHAISCQIDRESTVTWWKWKSSNIRQKFLPLSLSFFSSYFSPRKTTVAEPLACWCNSFEQSLYVWKWFLMPSQWFFPPPQFSVQLLSFFFFFFLVFGEIKLNHVLWAELGKEGFNRVNSGKTVGEKCFN